jgi:tripartite-type tricarboxylate transporter receptor subunit TctC
VPTVRERLAQMGADPMPLGPREFDAHVVKEIDANAALVRSAGIKFN